MSGDSARQREQLANEYQLRFAGLTQRIRAPAAFFAVFATVLGARLWLIDRTGSEVPILDQWDAEGAALLKPFVDGSLRIADLFAPHNEHRPVMTRLWALLLFVLNGQWDPFLEIVTNAIFLAATAVLFAFAAARLVPETRRGFVLAAVTLWAALPYAQENTIWGFQSAFYFLLGFSLVAIWALVSNCRWRVIAIGAAAALVACFTMISGFLCAIAVLCVLLLRAATKRARFRDITVVGGVGLAIAVIGWLSGTPAVQHHAGFAAPSIASWLTLFGRCLAWPFCNWALVAFVIYLPLAGLAATYLKRSELCDPRKAELLFGIGVWVILQAAAISYGRAGHETRVVSRYMDVLAIGAVANFLALLILLQRNPRGSALIAGGGWTALVVIGAAVTSIAQVRYESGRRPYMDNAVMVARAFLATHDAAVLRSSSLTPIPYPNPDRIAALLNDPTIQRILPPAIHPPLTLEAATDQTAFALGGLPPQIANKSRERVWGSYSVDGVRATGSFHSNPVASHLPYLEIEIAGYLRPGLWLNVNDLRTGKEHRVIPTRPIDNQWRAAYVSVSQGAHVIAAEDARDDQWFAFREPRECGRLSYLALRVARSGVALTTFGALLLVLLLLWATAAKKASAAVTRREQAHETH